MGSTTGSDQAHRRERPGDLSPAGAYWGLAVIFVPYEFREDDPSVHQAARFGLTVGSLGILVLALSAYAVRHGVDHWAAAAAPVFLFGGGIWAFVRTYQAWRHFRTWFAWQGAGWFLLLLAMVVLTMSLSVLG